jgi:L-2-hydroxyglutarate oxidase LhgO
MTENQYDIIIVGGGIVGLASAYKINLKYPDKKVLVLEKETEVAAHQTGHNSGVIHSGIYYKPGSYRARNCVEGRRELVAFAREHHINHDICGKVIVATKPSELAHMHKVFNNGLQNGVEGIELINAARIKEIEPFCSGLEGIWVPCTGIIDYAEVARKLAELIKTKFNSLLLTGHEVTAFDKHSDDTTVITNKGNFNAKYIITCGGLQSDRLASKDGVKTDATIVGFRGDYYDLTEQGKSKVRNLIYPVPNPVYPFLGVHFTRMINGETECGPNAVFVFKREGYGKTDFSLKDTAQAFSFSGTWKFFYKNWRFGLDEYRRAFSKRLFLQRLQGLIPSLEMNDITPGRAGVRAMLLVKEGAMIDDFKIAHNDHAIHILNAPSPAATASLAIGGRVQQMVDEYFDLN